LAVIRWCSRACFKGTFPTPLGGLQMFSLRSSQFTRNFGERDWVRYLGCKNQHQVEEIVENFTNHLEGDFSVSASDIALHLDRIVMRHLYADWGQPPSPASGHTQTGTRSADIPSTVQKTLIVHIPVSPECKEWYSSNKSRVELYIGTRVFICHMKYYICRCPDYFPTGLLFYD
jgi:hypothetical protein